MRSSTVPTRKVQIGLRTDGRPIFLIQGGSSSEPPPAPADPAPADPPPAPAPVERGFPENTPVAEMTTEQALAYTRYHSHKHESLANTYKSLGDPDTIKAKLAAYDAAEAAKLTPSEQAINEAKAAGRTEALLEANSSAATAILEANLAARGKTAEQISGILAPINASAFIADGKVDTAKVLAFAKEVAGEPGTTTTTRQRLDMGQGNRGNRSTATGVDAGRELYATTRGKQKTT